MLNVTFRPIGENPERDAQVGQVLCTSVGIDSAITSEFGSMVSIYANGDLETLAERVEQRYGGQYPMLSGDFVLLDDREIGMAYSGVHSTEVIREDDFCTEILSGVNVSAWILTEGRQWGVGSLAIDHATRVAYARTCDETDETWYDQQIWTSIHNENIASQKACQSAGFVRSYPAAFVLNRTSYIHYA